MNRMKKLLASILAVSTCISMLTCAATATDVELQPNVQAVVVGSETETVDLTTGWRYLDNNTDPAGDSATAGYDRLSWTKADYDDSSWKTAAGRFGAKRGAIADLGGGCTPDVLLNQYIDGNSGDDIPAFFFRTTFQVKDAAAVTKLQGQLLYDDAAIV